MKKNQRPEVTDCSGIISHWLDEFRAEFGGTLTAKRARPITAMSPITAWTGPTENNWSDSHEEMFFSIKEQPVFDKGKPKWQSGKFKEVISRNYRPSWILEAILSSLYQNCGQSHMVRPKAYTKLDIGLDEHTLEEVSLYLYGMFEDLRDAQNVKYWRSQQEGYSGPVRAPRVYGHWSIYPILMSDHTHPYVLDEIRKRVKGKSKLFICEHAMRLKRTETKFYEWVDRNAVEYAFDHEEDEACNSIAKKLKPFMMECKSYDR